MITDIRRPRLTDPGHPYNCPVFTLHECYSTPQKVKEIKARCQRAKIGCKNDCKPALAKMINSALRTPRRKRQKLLDQPGKLEEFLLEGSAKAREAAIKTIKEIRDTMSFSKI